MGMPCSPTPWSPSHVGIRQLTGRGVTLAPADGDTPLARPARPRFSAWLDRSGGAIFVAFGAALLTLRRQAACDARRARPRDIREAIS
jgi:hypothetical protein